MASNLAKRSIQQTPKSVSLMQGDGPVDSGLVARVLWAIAADVGMKSITPQIGNTQCNALGKLMKLKEMELRFGTSLTPGGEKVLPMTTPTPSRK